MADKIELDYTWKAVLDDDTEIAQIDDKGNEVLFAEVEKNKDKLSYFHIISADGEEQYSVDMNSGEIIGPNVTYTVDGEKFELIYKRRNKVRLATGTGALLPGITTHIIGLESDTDKKEFQVFAGKEMKPKEVNVKEGKKDDETVTNVTSNVNKIND